MAALGYYQSPPNWGIDGYVDRELIDSLGRFERDHGILPYGPVSPGSLTEQALNRQLLLHRHRSISARQACDSYDPNQPREANGRWGSGGGGGSGMAGGNILSLPVPPVRSGETGTVLSAPQPRPEQVPEMAAFPVSIPSAPVSVTPRNGSSSSSNPVTVVGHVSPASGQQILARAGQFEKGIITHPRGEGCVALVKDSVPDLADTRTADWKPGPKMTGFDNPPLRPGTALATFGTNGKYGGDGVAHAVVFESYETQNEQSGMVVIEQSAKMPARSKFIPFGLKDGNPRYRAESYSVVTK